MSLPRAVASGVRTVLAVPAAMHMPLASTQTAILPIFARTLAAKAKSKGNAKKPQRNVLHKNQIPKANKAVSVKQSMKEKNTGNSLSSLIPFMSLIDLLRRSRWCGGW